MRVGEQDSPGKRKGLINKEPLKPHFFSAANQKSIAWENMFQFHWPACFCPWSHILGQTSEREAGNVRKDWLLTFWLKKKNNKQLLNILLWKWTPLHATWYYFWKGRYGERSQHEIYLIWFRNISWEEPVEMKFENPISGQVVFGFKVSNTILQSNFKWNMSKRNVVSQLIFSIQFYGEYEQKKCGFPTHIFNSTSNKVSTDRFKAATDIRIWPSGILALAATFHWYKLQSIDKN